MKTIIKNKRSYRTKIGRPCNNNRDVDNQELPEQTHSSGSGSQQAGGARGTRGGDEASDVGGGFSNSDESNKEDSDAEEDGSGAGSAGTKRKATGSGGSGEKGKQRKL